MELSKQLAKNNMDYKLIAMNITCRVCNYINLKYTKEIEYTGKILKTLWCEKCNEPIVIKIKINNRDVIITDEIDALSIYIPRKPDIGITIRPRGKKLTTID